MAEGPERCPVVTSVCKGSTNLARESWDWSQALSSQKRAQGQDLISPSEERFQTSSHPEILAEKEHTHGSHGPRDHEVTTRLCLADLGHVTFAGIKHLGWSNGSWNPKPISSWYTGMLWDTWIEVLMEKWEKDTWTLEAQWKQQQTRISLLPLHLKGRWHRKYSHGRGRLPSWGLGQTAAWGAF